jgi:2-iminoacetate synthase
MLTEFKQRSFIDEEKIYSLLGRKTPDKYEVREILSKASAISGLEAEEVAALLQVTGTDLLADIYSSARTTKEKIYGKRVVLFAPLYVTNECVNNCLYCGFRAGNTLLKRRTLTADEVVQQAKILTGKGHTRVLLVFGESPQVSSPSAIAQTVRAIYKESEMRIVHVNAAPMSEEGFKILRSSGIGVYQLFQETYHYKTYNAMHPGGHKKDFLWRSYAMDRAIKAGLEDVGIGALFGLYDYRFEVLAILQHVRHLESEFGFGCHTISIPRLKPALGAVLTEPPDPVSDEQFKKIVGILRLAVPYTGIVISTREHEALRRDVILIGASQISAGSRTSPGGYSTNEQEIGRAQFTLEDTRALDEVIGDICDAGYFPSLCCTCYRVGRVGDKFVSLTREGRMKDFCLPNAILTFQEYLLNHASARTRAIGEKTIAQAVAEIPDEHLRSETLKKVEKINRGCRDLYF